FSQGKMTVDGITLDPASVTVPCYFQSSKEDHIAPHRSVYNSSKLFSGPCRFMVGGSGHIAGVVNPPSANKYMYWTNRDEDVDTIEQWWEGAKETAGSWWPEWNEWLMQYAGKEVAPRIPGAGKYKALEDAPGSYVKVRSDSA
ncbi:MAG: class I poly(R)-hydroxyalkanoic acid synthase, partial [Pseudomonadota bacterium]